MGQYLNSHDTVGTFIDPYALFALPWISTQTLYDLFFRDDVENYKPISLI